MTAASLCGVSWRRTNWSRGSCTTTRSPARTTPSFRASPRSLWRRRTGRWTRSCSKSSSRRTGRPRARGSIGADPRAWIHRYRIQGAGALEDTPPCSCLPVEPVVVLATGAGGGRGSTKINVLSLTFPQRPYGAGDEGEKEFMPMNGRVALVTGVANKWSIAWAIAQRLARAGAQVVFTYQNERFEKGV